MVSDNYVSLHTHSEHSQLDGFSQVEAIAHRAASLGQSAVALTDHQECSGHIELEKACQKEGIKPIYGMEGYLVNSIEQTRAEKTRHNSHFCVFAENRKGLRNLWSLSSMTYIKGFYNRALADWDMLREYKDGLIVTDGCMLADMARFVLEDKEAEALQWASKYLEVFGENNFFMELHTWQFIDPQTDDQKELNTSMTKVNLGKIEIANRLGIPLIVVNDAHYSNEEDWEHHALFWTLRTGDAGDRLENGKTAAWIMSSDEVRFWMSKHGVPTSITDQAIANTSLIADRCDVEIERKLHIPVLTKSKEEELELFMNNLEKGFKEKVVDKGLDVPVYMGRIEKECPLIIERGLPGYFNIVADYCQEFKNRGWLLAAGRGSSGGSLVAYLDNINELDPVARGLLFERFLNPGRLDYPDIDTDIPKSKRQEAIGYLEGKYGADKVCRIGTFGRLGAKQVLNDLCRVMDIPHADRLAMTKIIAQVESIENEEVPEEDENSAVRTWEEILETKESDLNPWVKKYPLLFWRMQNMIGLIRQSGTHASGVIISDESLIGELPLRKKKDQAMTTQFDMHTLADLGFIKFDLLGVKTLDVLMEAQIFITGKSDPKFFYNFTDEQYADPAIWEPIGRGETIGVFQMNTPAGTQLAKKIKPQNEYEVATLISVDRPGVIRAGMTDEFVERRKGLRDIVTPHPFMTEILEETYGIVVYQEQVLQIVQRLAGYSLEEADAIRAIVGKKKMDKMREEKPRFIEHCLKNPEFVRLAEGRAAQKATQCWDQIEQTGAYAFGKAHAQGYSLLSSWGAWLAHYHPLEFLTACLIHRPEQLPTLVREIKRKEFQVLPPDLNQSGTRFTIVNDAVRYGLQDLRGVGPAALAAIMENRPFASLKDMYDRVDKRSCKKTVIENLIKIGAMDLWGPRYALLREYYALRNKKNEENIIPDFQDPAVIQQIELNIVGNYITEDPLDKYRDRIDGHCLDDPDKIDDLNEGEIVEIGGVLARIHEHNAKNGLMAFLDVQWDAQEFPIVCFADSYRENRSLLQVDSPVIIRAIRGKKGVYLHNVIRLDYVTN